MNASCRRRKLFLRYISDERRSLLNDAFYVFMADSGISHLLAVTLMPLYKAR